VLSPEEDRRAVSPYRTPPARRHRGPRGRRRVSARRAADRRPRRRIGPFAGRGQPPGRAAAAGSYPASYPWAHAAAGGLFDVTAGAVRTCVRGYLCTATAGFDGPTDRDAAKGCKQHTVSLTPYLGQTITLRFTSREHLIGKVTSFFEDGNVLKVS